MSTIYLYTYFETNNNQNVVTKDGDNFVLKRDDIVVADLYKFEGERIAVDKTNDLKYVGASAIIFRDGFNIDQIAIDIEYKIPIDFNYIYIEKLNRYYYVDDYSIVNNKLVTLQCSIDILMSFKKGIMNLKALVDRNEKESNPRINDEQMPVLAGVQWRYSTLAETSIINNTSNGIYVINGFGIKAGDSVTNDQSTCELNQPIYLNEHNFQLFCHYFLNPALNFFTLFTNPTERVFSIKYTPLDLGYGNINQYYPLQYLSALKTYELMDLNFDSNKETNSVILGRALENITKKDVGTLNYPIENFYDYNGYSDYYLYLPLYGTYKINPNEFLNFVSPNHCITIKISIQVDNYTGECCYILKDFGNTIKQIVNFQGFIDIPIGQTGFLEMKRNLLTNGIKLGAQIASAVGGFMMPPQTVSTTQGTVTARAINPSTKRMRNVAQQVTDEQKVTTYSQNEVRPVSEVISSATNMLNSAHASSSGSSQSNCLLLSELDTKVKLYHCRPIVNRDVYDSPEYKKLVGRPLGKIRQLGSLKGYTKVGEVHIEGEDFNTATSAEISMVEEALYNGIILPY